MRYAQGLALCAQLRAGTVSTHQIEEGVALLLRALQQWSPGVEASAEEPGLFWLNASGMESLYPSLGKWGQGIRQALQKEGFVASVVVGFSRFGSFAVARSRRESLVFSNAASERAVAMAVPLDRLLLEPGVRDTLSKLGVRTVSCLVALPAEGVLKRFGAAAHRLHGQASGVCKEPLVAAPIEDPICDQVVLEFAVLNAHRLLFLIKSRLPKLMQALANRYQALTALHITLLLDNGGECQETLRPAAPTLNQAQLSDLVRLWLERIQLRAGVVELRLRIQGVCADSEQLRLFAIKPKRDIQAANRALARIRAELGEQAVVRARLNNAHLPEASYGWEPLSSLPLPQVDSSCERLLIRRIFSPPQGLPFVAKHTRNNGLLLNPEQGPIERLLGPYLIAGGWWRREVSRGYYYAQTQRGDLLWIFLDHKRRRWFCHGRVE
jgi:protein ImuB